MELRASPLTSLVSLCSNYSDPRHEHVCKSPDKSHTVCPSQTMIVTIPPSSTQVLAGSETYFTFEVFHKLMEWLRILYHSGIVPEEINATNVLNILATLQALRKDPLHVPYKTFSHQSDAVIMERTISRLLDLFSKKHSVPALSPNNNFISTWLF
jgi:hypothetical protein